MQQKRSAMATLDHALRSRAPEQQNPRSPHILWASILVEDAAIYREIVGIMSAEEWQSYEYQKYEMNLSKSTRGSVVPDDRLIGGQLTKLLNEASKIGCVDRVLSKIRAIEPDYSTMLDALERVLGPGEWRKDRGWERFLDDKGFSLIRQGRFDEALSFFSICPTRACIRFSSVRPWQSSGSTGIPFPLPTSTGRSTIAARPSGKNRTLQTRIGLVAKPSTAR